MNNVHKVLESGWVERYHAATKIPNQLLGQHQWGVAVIILHICKEPTAALLKIALLHDAPEIHTGDVPAPIKDQDQKLKQLLDDIEETWWTENVGGLVGLSKEEQRFLKLADCLEGAIYCIRQYSLGYKGALYTYSRWREFINQRFSLEFRVGCGAEQLLIGAWKHYVGEVPNGC